MYLESLNTDVRCKISPLLKWNQFIHSNTGINSTFYEYDINSIVEIDILSSRATLDSLLELFRKRFSRVH